MRRKVGQHRFAVRNLNLKMLALSAVFFSLPLASGQVYYVRQGANGNGSGSDWTNAYSSLPASLVRGATYYVADGTYSGYDFDDPESGSAFITVKKAGAQDHGNAPGWASTYGDGQAVFGRLAFKEGYYVIDGQRRANWETNYGFRVLSRNVQNDRAIWIANDKQQGFVELRYVDIGGDANAPGDRGIYALDSVHDITISHCYIHDVQVPILLRTNNRFLLEYSLIGPNRRFVSGAHMEAISDSASDNVTIRYNRFRDILNTGFIVVLASGGKPYTVRAAENWQISGNVFYYRDGNPAGHWGVGTGVINVINDQRAENWKVHNNAIVNVRGWSASIRLPGSNNKVFNNIWFNLGDTPDGKGTSTATGGDYNWFFLNNGRAAPSEPNSTYGQEDPFVDWRNEDFRLKGFGIGALPIDNGFNLSNSAGFNDVDPDGSVRGADGQWDIGAFELSDGNDVAAPNPPTNLRVTIGK